MYFKIPSIIKNIQSLQQDSSILPRGKTTEGTFQGDKRLS